MALNEMSGPNCLSQSDKLTKKDEIVWVVSTGKSVTSDFRFKYNGLNNKIVKQTEKTI